MTYLIVAGILFILILNLEFLMLPRARDKERLAAWIPLGYLVIFTLFALIVDHHNSYAADRSDTEENETIIKNLVYVLSSFAAIQLEVMNDLLTISAFLVISILTMFIAIRYIKNRIYIEGLKKTIVSGLILFIVLILLKLSQI